MLGFFCVVSLFVGEVSGIVGLVTDRFVGCGLGLLPK